MEARAAADVINDFGRDPIGEGKEERVRCITLCLIQFKQHRLTLSNRHQKYNRDLKTLLDNKQDDTAPVAEIGERNPGGKDAGGDGKRKRLALEEITRFTMVKRIW